MHIKDNILNFLKDQEYYIDIFNDYLHIYNYDVLTTLTDKTIALKLKDFSLIIEGNNLCISKVNKEELLIKGTINNMRFNR